MQNRQKDEICRDVLTVCNGGSAITKIMFHGYMTHQQVKVYTQELVLSGLLEFDPLENKFFTTPKGIHYLNVVEQMTELFSVSVKRTAKERLV